MHVDKETLRRVIPHAGTMCLLDEVEFWDEIRIVCLSRTHHAADNPLRSHGMLRSVHAAEYGAQAMAVHGGLLARAAGQPPQAGYLAALREVTLHTDRLDTLEGPLRVEAERLMGGGGSLMYRFAVSAAGAPVAAGRAMVMTPGEGE